MSTATPTYDAARLAEIADLALIPPTLITDPLPRYGYDRLDFGMTIGIERTRGGRLWACWVGGGDSQEGYFVLATSDDDGETWSDPRLVIDPHDDSHPLPRRTLVGNLWLDPKGRLWLFFDQSMTYFDGRGGAWCTTCENPDADAPEWSAPRRIWHGCSLNKPIVLSTGEWLMPLSLWSRDKIQTPLATPGVAAEDWPLNPFADSFPELDELRMAHVFASNDEGESWTRRGGVRFPQADFDEHNIVELRDSRLWMTARTGKNLGMYQSFSEDGGHTWSPAEHSGLEHSSSRHCMRRLPSGRILLVKHGYPVETRPEDRSHLTAYVSKDEGRTWLGGLAIDDRLKVSYPDVALAPDGRIFVSYDLNRYTEGNILLARFTEEDVLARELVTPGSALRKLISRANPDAVAARIRADEARRAGK